MNILFTSAGRRVELLDAFRRAYKQLGLAGEIMATDIDPLAPALAHADRSFMVPLVDDPRLPQKLADICSSHEVNLLVPLVDRDIPLLVAHRGSLAATGTKLLIPTDEASAIVNDKWLSHQFFEEMGVSSPRSWLPEGLDWARMTYPLFIKPRRGSAAEHTFKVCDERELRFFIDYVPDPIVQEYVPGAEITSDVLCDLEGNVRAVVSRRRIEVRAGEVAKGVTIHDPRITETAALIAKGLQARGPITVQCLMRDDEPLFTEVNHRFGGGLPLAIAAGVDVPVWLVSLAAGLPLETPPLGTYRTGLYISRYDQSAVLGEEERARIAGGRL
ncbi:MAG: ATP-grasp domain-containing protein [Actinomycetota bacterium]